ncbi:hypothetical protein P885DRAFT_59121 [Corynascus similis CBS 632.67]
MKGWQASREMVVEQATRDAMFDPDNPPPDLKEPIHRIQAYREASATITLEVARHPLDHEIAVSNVSSLSLLVGCRPGSGSSFDVVDPVMAELRITLVFSDVEDLALKKIRRHTDPPIDADPLSDPSFSVGTPLTTTRETLPLRKRGIAIRELPKTFRDAVVMTLCLGVRYLWIDSLCIVQDDAEDWAREAGQMAKVYRNAYLTLNAATSDADTEGFLRPRPIPDRVRLPPTSPSLSRRKREEHGFYLHLRPPQGRRWLDPEMDSPLLPVLSTRPRPVQAPALYSLFWQAPGRSEVADIVVQMKVGGSGKKSVWVVGGFDRPDAVKDSAKLFVAMLARLPHVLEEGFIEQRFGLLLKQLGDDSRRYKRVGFIDGVVLQKSLLGAIRGHGMFTIVGYARPFQKDDIYEVERDNDLASTPLVVNAVELEIY